MDPTEENIYHRIFESLRNSLAEKPVLISDINDRMSQLGLKKDYDQIIARVRSPPNTENGELLETLRYAQEMAQYGMETSMIDRSKRSSAENLRAFIIHMHTKTLKTLSEQLLSSERTFRKAIEGQPSFSHQNEPSQRNMMTICKHLTGFANKISNNIYCIQKVQASKLNVEALENSKYSELLLELQQIKAQNLALDTKLVQLQAQNTQLLDVNRSLLRNQQTLNESLQLVMKKQQQNHSQIQQFKQQIRQIIALYESQKVKWKAQIAHLKQLLDQNADPSSKLQEMPQPEATEQ